MAATRILNKSDRRTKIQPVTNKSGVICDRNGGGCVCLTCWESCQENRSFNVRLSDPPNEEVGCSHPARVKVLSVKRNSYEIVHIF